MARWDSVTVSMAALRTGMFSPMLRVPMVRVSVCAGTTSLCAGSSRTSSKVRPSGIVSRIMRCTSYSTARLFLRRRFYLAPFVVDRYFQRPQELLVLRRELDFADLTARRLRRCFDLDGFRVVGLLA